MSPALQVEVEVEVEVQTYLRDLTYIHNTLTQMQIS